MVMMSYITYFFIFLLLRPKTKVNAIKVNFLLIFACYLFRASIYVIFLFISDIINNKKASS